MVYLHVQSYVCPFVGEVNLKGMGKISIYLTPQKIISNLKPRETWGYASQTMNL